MPSVDPLNHGVHLRTDRGIRCRRLVVAFGRGAELRDHVHRSADPLVTGNSRDHTPRLMLEHRGTNPLARDERHALRLETFHDRPSLPPASACVQNYGPAPAAAEYAPRLGATGDPGEAEVTVTVDWASLRTAHGTSGARKRLPCSGRHRRKPTIPSSSATSNAASASCTRRADRAGFGGGGHVVGPAGSVRSRGTRGAGRRG
jgi:hypothetical protein